MGRASAPPHSLPNCGAPEPIPSSLWGATRHEGPEGGHRRRWQRLYAGLGAGARVARAFPRSATNQRPGRRTQCRGGGENGAPPSPQGLPSRWACGRWQGTRGAPARMWPATKSCCLILTGQPPALPLPARVQGPVPTRGALRAPCLPVLQAPVKGPSWPPPDRHHPREPCSGLSHLCGSAGTCRAWPRSRGEASGCRESSGAAQSRCLRCLRAEQRPPPHFLKGRAPAGPPCSPRLVLILQGHLRRCLDG